MIIGEKNETSTAIKTRACWTILTILIYLS